MNRHEKFNSALALIGLVLALILYIIVKIAI